MDSFEKNVERLEQSLSAPGGASEFAVEMRDKGISQADLYAIFEAARGRHADEEDETKLNALLDVMDYISGWCSRANALYPNE